MTASDAVAFFSAHLRFQIDVFDVHEALAGDDAGFLLVDTRGDASWQQSHIAGALHLPTALIPERAPELVAAGRPVVTYCWGPGCNGATRAALAFAQLGHPVREMLGGIEYWIREGFPVETPTGTVSTPPDPLTAACGC